LKGQDMKRLTLSIALALLIGPLAAAESPDLCPGSAPPEITIAHLKSAASRLDEGKMNSLLMQGLGNSPKTLAQRIGAAAEIASPAEMQLLGSGVGLADALINTPLSGNINSMLGDYGLLISVVKSTAAMNNDKQNASGMALGKDVFSYLTGNIPGMGSYMALAGIADYAMTRFGNAVVETKTMWWQNCYEAYYNQTLSDEKFYANAAYYQDRKGDLITHFDRFWEKWSEPGTKECDSYIDYRQNHSPKSLTSALGIVDILGSRSAPDRKQRDAIRNRYINERITRAKKFAKEQRAKEISRLLIRLNAAQDQAYQHLVEHITVEGTVSDSEKNPLSGVQMELPDLGGIRTDANGYYSLGLPRCELYTWQRRHPRQPLLLSATLVPPSGKPLSRLEPVAMDSGQFNSRIINFTLSPSFYSIEVHLMDSTQPILNGRILLLREGAMAQHSEGTFFHTGRGTYRLSQVQAWPGSTYYVMATAPGYLAPDGYDDSVQTDVRIPDADASATPISIVLKMKSWLGVLAVNVVDPDRMDVEGALIHLESLNPESGVSPENEYSGGLDLVTFQNLRAGTYRVTASKEGYQKTRKTVSIQREKATETLTLLLRPLPPPPEKGGSDVNTQDLGLDLGLGLGLGSEHLERENPSTQPQPSNPTTPVGRWNWFNGNTQHFKADGTVNGPGHTWSGSGRQVVVRWGDKWVDTLTLSEDGQRMEGKNQYGHRVWATLAAPDPQVPDPQVPALPAIPAFENSVSSGKGNLRSQWKKGNAFAYGSVRPGDYPVGIFEIETAEPITLNFWAGHFKNHTKATFNLEVTDKRTGRIPHTGMGAGAVVSLQPGQYKIKISTDGTYAGWTCRWEGPLE
jgi:hypothetical protein